MAPNVFDFQPQQQNFKDPDMKHDPCGGKNTVFGSITAHIPISARLSNSVVFRLQAMYLFLYKSICCWFPFELPRQGRGNSNGNQQHMLL